MTLDERFKKLLDADPATLAAVDAALSGRPAAPPPTVTRLLRPCDAVRASGLSRSTLWRLCAEGRLPTVEIRRGQRRIPLDALAVFTAGGDCHA